MEISDNIRAEIARRNESAVVVMSAIGMANSTWYRKMAKPSLWSIGDLDKIARHLRIDRGRLTG